jgi:hypothetical protein
LAAWLAAIVVAKVTPRPRLFWTILAGIALVVSLIPLFGLARSTAILLLIDGSPVTELWGHLDWSSPIEVDPFMLSPVTITTPLADDEVAVGSVTFRGQATVFEATVLVTLLDGDGRVLEEGFVTASTGAPERGTWAWTVELTTPGTYMVVAAESDPSGGEGRPPFSTTRTISATG